MKIDSKRLLAILQAETERASGCTEIAAAALVTAQAAHTLAAPVERLHLTVSPNVYKNGVHAAIPGTRECGLALSAALGAFIPGLKRG